MWNVSSIDKAFDILLLLSSEPRPLGVREVGRRLELSPPTVHRLLSTMLKYDLVQQTDSGSEYRLGWACLSLVRSVLSGTDLGQVAPDIARNLRDVTGETVTAQVRVGREQIVVVEAEGTHELRRRVGVGRRMLLHAGASGRAILAHLPAREIEAYLAEPLEQVGPRTQTDAAALSALLAEVRANGYAASEQESVIGVAAISVPVFRADGSVSGSLSISGPDVRMGADVRTRLIPLLQGAGRSLSRAMGSRASHASGDRRAPDRTDALITA
jgi:DNA-binding IclR family transcriptional regulator